MNIANNLIKHEVPIEQYLCSFPEIIGYNWLNCIISNDNAHLDTITLNQF